jgi:hypothetical protein
MKDKKLLAQKFRAQLDEWKADIAKMKAKASMADADAQLAMNKHIEALEGARDTAETKLAELAKAGDDTWDSAKKGVESAWDSMKTAVSNTAARFKD